MITDIFNSTVILWHDLSNFVEEKAKYDPDYKLLSVIMLDQTMPEHLEIPESKNTSVIKAIFHICKILRTIHENNTDNHLNLDELRKLNQILAKKSDSKDISKKIEKYIQDNSKISNVNDKQNESKTVLINFFKNNINNYIKEKLATSKEYEVFNNSAKLEQTRKQSLSENASHDQIMIHTLANILFILDKITNGSLNQQHLKSFNLYKTILLEIKNPSEKDEKIIKTIEQNITALKEIYELPEKYIFGHRIYDQETCGQQIQKLIQSFQKNHQQPWTTVMDDMNSKFTKLLGRSFSKALDDNAEKRNSSFNKMNEILRKMAGLLNNEDKESEQDFKKELINLKEQNKILDNKDLKMLINYLDKITELHDQIAQQDLSQSITPIPGLTGIIS